MGDYKKSYSNNADDKSVKKIKRQPKKKVCTYCVEKATSIDYKDIAKLKRATTEKGKILPRRTSGICAKHQRQLATAIKRAREMALMPYKAE